MAKHDFVCICQAKSYQKVKLEYFTGWSGGWIRLIIQPTQFLAKSGIGAGVELGKIVMLSILRPISDLVSKWLYQCKNFNSDPFLAYLEPFGSQMGPPCGKGKV